MSISSYNVTFYKLANHINPGWTLDEWLLWPPDMFALCSSVVNRTGLYKLCLLDAEWWNTREWESDIWELSKLWIKSSSNQLLRKADYTKFKEKPVFKKYYDVLEQEFKNPNIDLLHLRVLGDLYKREPKPEHMMEKEFAKALLFLFVLADASCSGLGFLGQPLAKENLEHRIFMAVANLLLNNTGSLSTINKFHGIVLPKMRTPQAGMVARSLSHHLSFHTTEVEVIWRTFPKLEAGKQSLNILAVPYPKKIEPADFELLPDSYQPVRYFKGNTEKDLNESFLDALINTVLDFSTQKNEVDLIVFPEMSLTEKQYLLLLEKFSEGFRNQQSCLQLPVVIAGIMKKNEKETGYPGVDDTFQNEVRMAVFFSGQWYTTTQRKHHRWQLDGGQIRQYELEGYFAVDKTWFEYASIAQRRLTILAPNNWLAVTALICEDLARQEPVSDVIRGIGPTLLMALLSDGPQLENRWSARYASVLADDPGTAVLSLTSEGMARRSKPAKPISVEKLPVIGLWKDMIKGYREFEIIEEADAVMFTISAINKQETTLDGRSDGGYASVFQLDSIQPRQVKFKKTEGILRSSSKNTVGAKEDRWNNIRELSALQFSVDAILDLLSDKKIIPSNKALAIDLILHLLHGEEPPKTDSRKFRERIISNIATAWIDPSALGIGASAGSGGSTRMTKAVNDLRLFAKLANESPDDETATLYERIVIKSRELLKDDQRSSADRQTIISILYNIYNRVVFWHPTNPDCFEIAGLNIKSALKMKSDILDVLQAQRAIAS